MNRFSQLARGSVLALPLLFCGCKGQLIKDTAATLSDSYTQLATQTADFNKQQNAARFHNMALRVAAAPKGQCDPRGPNPLNPKPTYVRLGHTAADADNTFEVVMAQLSEAHLAPPESVCRQLLTCEAHPDTAGCQAVCYTEPESKCIDQMSKAVAAQADEKTAGHGLLDPTSPAGQSLALMNSKLSVIVFSPNAIPQAAGVAASLHAVGAYMSSVAAIANRSPKDLTPIKDHFTADEAKVADTYKSMNPSGLTDAQAAAQKQLVATSDAADKLIGDIKKMVDAEHDANKIKAIMNEAEADYQTLYAQLKGNASLISVQLVHAENASFVSTAEQMQRDIASAKTVQGKAAALEASQMALADHQSRLKAAEDIPAKFNELLEKMAKAHDALMTLANDPTNDQQRQIAELTVTNFALFASDLLGLYHTFA